MSRRPSASQALAMKAAALASQDDDEPEDAAAVAPEPAIPAHQDEPAKGRRTRGRPKGRREVAARQTIYLDDKRHAALSRIADAHGRSVHSLILEGIDHVIGKPKEPGWR